MAGHVFGSQHGVLHARVPRHGNPLIHIEFVRRIGGRRGLAVGQFIPHKGTHAEMNEHTVAPSLPFLQLRQAQTLAAFFLGILISSIRQRGRKTG